MIEIKTFGCKVNTYDTGLLESRFAKVGAIDTPVGVRVLLFNTCAVTGEATADAQRQIRRAKRDDPNTFIAVTGCAAQVDTEKFEGMPEVDLVVANSHKGDIENLIAKKLRGELSDRVFKSNIFKKEDLEGGGGLEDGHTRAFLKIQDGCNSFCTFCVIPFARGKSRSLTISEITERTQELLLGGVREIVLTGVHIGDYEFGLENLIENLLLKTRVPRLRLTSLEPIELSDRLFELFEDPRLCPHFHMSIQSASTRVLANMKRKYDAQKVEWALTEIARRVPHAFVGMDVIAGFVDEGEQEFLETYERLDRMPWSKIHVFPYSERPGTYAMRLPNKNERSVISSRASRLRELSHARHEQVASRQLGALKKVLILKNNQGLSRDFWPVEFSGTIANQAANQAAHQVNEERQVQITALSRDQRGRYDGSLVGQILA